MGIFRVPAADEVRACAKYKRFTPDEVYAYAEY